MCWYLVHAKLLANRAYWQTGTHMLVVTCYMDATTGLAIGSQHGLGKVKHVDTVFLWTQQQVLSGKFKLAKRIYPGHALADIFTKSLESQRTEDIARTNALPLLDR